MNPDDPRHGTSAGAGAHYRDGEQPCEPCLNARRLYYRRYHKQRRQGYVRTIDIGHAGIWQRIDEAVNVWGFTYTIVAARYNIGDNQLCRIHHAGPDSNVYPGTWLKLRDLNPADIGPTNVGTVRRFQALHAVGWTSAEVCRRAGIDREIGKRILRGEHGNLLPSTRDKVAAVYEAVCMQTPPPSAGATRARLRAAREQWRPPLAWDNIDDPTEEPADTYKPVLNRPRAELLAEWHHLLDLGVSEHVAAQQLGVKPESVAQALGRQAGAA